MATHVGTLLVNIIGNAGPLAATLNNSEKMIERFGSRLFFLGSRITGAVTVPVVGFMAAVNKIGSEFDSAMTESLAIMDDVSAEMRDKMKARAIEISRTSKFSAKEVAEAYYDLASAGLNAQQSLESIGLVTTFAQAGLMKASEAGEFLAGAVSSVGLEMVGATSKVEGMARVADVLTKANNVALGTVQDFSKALTKQFGGAMKTFNIPLEQGMALLAGYAENNIRGARASTLASMAVRDVQVSTIRATAAWRDYGISVFDVEGNLRKMPDVLDQILMRMKGFSKEQVMRFTTGDLPMDEAPAGKKQSPMETTQMFKDINLPFRSISALQQLLKSAGQMRIFEEQFNNSAGEAAKVAAKQAEAMAVKWKMALHSIQAAAIQLYDAFKPILIEVFKMVGEWGVKLEQLALKFNTVDDSTKKWIAGIVVGIAAVGPLLLMIGGLSLMVGGLVIIFGRTLGAIAAIGNAVKVAIPIVTSFSALGAGTATAWAKVLPVFTGIAENLVHVGRGVIPLILIFKSVSPAIAEIAKHYEDADKKGKGLNSTVKEQESLWSQTKKTIAGLSEFGTALMNIIQKGWQNVGKAIVIVLEELEMSWKAIKRVWGEFLGEWVRIGKAFAEIGSDFLKWLDQWGVSIAEFILKIPVLGPLLRSAWEMGVDYATRFFNFVLPYWDRLITKAKEYYNIAATKISENTPAEVKGLAAAAKEFARRFDINKDNEWIPIVADVVRGYSTSIGATPILEGKPLNYGNMLNTIPRAHVPNLLRGPTLAGNFPNIGEGGYPDIPPPTGGAKRDPVGDAYRQLMGGGEKDWQNTFKAFKEHREEILANEDALERLRDAYMKVRLEIDEIPELEKIFETHIFEQNFARLSEVMGEFNIDLHELRTGGMTLKEFGTKHAAEIERLTQRFSEQTPEIQHLIREWQRLGDETADFEHRTASLIRSQNDFNDAALKSIDSAAKLADKEEELNQFRMSEGDRTLRGLTKNYEKMELEFGQAVAKMVTDWINAEPEYQASMERTTIEFMRNGQRLLEITKRGDLERVASNLVANDLIKRSFHNLTDDQLRDIITITYATRDWVLALGQVQQGFAGLAGVFDKAGTGILSWLAEIIGLFAEAKQVSSDLAVAATVTKGAWKQKSTVTAFDEEGNVLMSEEIEQTDWKGLAAGILDIFNAVVKGIELLDKATDSSSTTRNVLGGIAVGGEIGKGIGSLFGPMGAIAGQLIGSVVGGLIGAFRNRTLKNIVKMTAKEWGTDISDELGKAIEKTMKEVGGNRQVAAALHFKEILDEAGGLNPDNFDTFKARLRDFFTFAANGLMPANEAMEEYSENFGLLADYIEERGGDLVEVFDEHIQTMRGLLEQGVIDAQSVRDFFGANFDRFAKNLEDSGKLAGKEWENVLALMREAGDMPQNVMDWFKTQTGLGGNQFAAAVRGVTDPFKDLGEKLSKSKGGIGEAWKEFKEAEQAIVDARKAHGDAGAAGEDTTETWDALQEAIAEATRAQDKYNRLVSEHSELEGERAKWIEGTKGAMDDLGLLILKTFNAATENGLDWVTVMEQMSPALTELAKGYGILGKKADNPAVARLLEMFDMYSSNKPLFEGIGSLTQGAITLSRLGGFDDEAAAATMRQQGRNFVNVQSVVAQRGGTHADALRPFLPFLAEMRRANKEDGLVLDDQTQLMIAQAEELRLLRPEVATMQEVTGAGFKGTISAIVHSEMTLNSSLGLIDQTLGIINGTLGGLTIYHGPDPGGTGGGTPPPPPGGNGGGGGGSTVLEFATAESPRTNVINITTQTVDQEFVSRHLIPMIEKAGSTNERGARTKLRNSVGIINRPQS